MPDIQYPWAEIEAAYITGQMTLREVADQFNVPYGTVRNHACGENSWKMKRDIFRDDLREGIIDAKRDAVLLDRTGFDDLTDVGCDKILSLAITNLTDRDEEEKPTLTELDQFAALMTKLQGIKYRRLNVPQPKQPIEHTHPAPIEDYPEDHILKLVEDKLAVSVDLVPLTIDSPDGNGEKDNGGS